MPRTFNFRFDAMLAWRVAVLAASSLVVGCASAASTGDKQRPNVVFVLIDDMGYGDLSVTGNKRVRTPNIDHLAAQGALLTNFHVTAPICSASRAAFMTGRYGQRSRISSYLSSRSENEKSHQANWLSLDSPSVARSFKSAGYVTAHFGKWHLGGGRDVGDAPEVREYGFDEALTGFEGLGDRVLIRNEPYSNYSQMSLALGRGKITWVDHKHQLTELYVDKSIDFIRRSARTPFFLQLWLNDVHDMHEPSPRQLSRLDRKDFSEIERNFLAVLVDMDRQLARLFKEIDRRGLRDNTLVILTSDNGPTAWPWFYTGVFPWFDKEPGTAPGSTAGLRGRKWSLYEGGIRVPLIVRWPGHVRPGTIDTVSLVAGIDLLPSLAPIAGFEPPSDLDGEDASEVFRGAIYHRKKPIFLEYGSMNDGAPQPYLERDRSPSLAMHEGQWKLLASPFEDRVELYDLQNDPAEKRNVAGLQAAKATWMLEQLRNWRSSLNY